ncbi:MAG: DedA family protein [Candidatus Omnitrophica bacterium]|nr:DedA family protein [Candidatus Omnitrophota bacterium]
MFKELIAWYMGSLETGGYPLITLLMAIESSVFPLPSEFVIPPAAHLAHSKGCFNYAGIILAGAVGSWIGASIMYWVARLAGRPLFLRFGRYILIPPEKVHGAERWATRFGSAGVFISRLLPVVRHLIGIPAGIVQMDYRRYSLYTVMGSAIWCSVLCWIGIVAGSDKELLAGELHRVSLWMGGALVVLGIMYYFLVHRYMKQPIGRVK